MKTHEELLAEVAREAASAPASPDCPSGGKHGTYTAYRHHGCRCPATKRLVKVQRRNWSVTADNERKSLQRLIRRNSVREEVVAAILAGRRRDVRPSQVEVAAAFRRAVALWGREVPTLAAKLDYTRGAVYHRLRKFDGESRTG